MIKVSDRQFVCYFHFTSIYDINLGITISLIQPNIEIHIPFGLIRIGWHGVISCMPVFKQRTFGIGIDRK